MRGLSEPAGARIASDVATTELITVMPGETLETAARLMAEHGTAHVIVASPQTGLPVGIVSTLDIARVAARVQRAGSSIPTSSEEEQPWPSSSKPAVFAAPGEAGSPVSLKPRYDNFIGGEWVAPVEGRYQDNLSPVTGQAFCQVPRSTAADIELALDAAHAAKDGWAAKSTTERAAVLNAIADAIDANLEMLAVAESWENGKPVRETLAADIPLAADHFRYFAGVIRGEDGSLTEIDGNTVAYHFREPLGVVAQIIPFNFPLLMAAWKIAPALAAGNCTVVKPASPTPWSILKFAEITRTSSRAGVLNIVNGPGAESGARARLQQAHRQGRLHRRDRHGRLIMGRRRAEPDPVDHGAGRQVAEHLLRRRDGPRRRLPRQGDRGPRAVRLQQGRGLHVPLAGARGGVDLRAPSWHGCRAHRSDHAGPPARPEHDDRGAGLQGRSSRRSRATSRSGARKAPRS